MAEDVDEFMEVVVNDYKSKFNYSCGTRDDYPSAFLAERKARLERQASDTMFSGKHTLSVCFVFKKL